MCSGLNTTTSHLPTAGRFSPEEILLLIERSGIDEPTGKSPKAGFLFSKTTTSKLSGISLRFSAVDGQRGHWLLGGKNALVWR